MVDEVLGIELAEPFQLKGWVGAETQQALAPGAVSG
jgi:hypothetical protein